MKIAYHRDKRSGKILRHYKLDDKLTKEEVNKRVEKYNSDDCNTDCAYAIEAIQGSFLEYLIDKCEKSDARIQEAIDRKGNYHAVCNDRKCKCPMVAGMPLWRDSDEQAADDWNRRANQNE